MIHLQFSYVRFDYDDENYVNCNLRKYQNKTFEDVKFETRINKLDRIYFFN